MKAWIAAAALLLTAPLEAQTRDISRPGPVPHPAAGTSFPEQVGELRRVHVLHYGENDLSANYDMHRGDDSVRLSVYIYPAPAVPQSGRMAACRAEMAELDRSIGTYHPGAEQIESGAAVAIPGSIPGLRLRSVHLIAIPLRSRDVEPVRSETRLFCYVGGDWLVKYRASSNAAFDAGAEIDMLIRLGPWPNRRPGEIALR